MFSLSDFPRTIVNVINMLDIVTLLGWLGAVVLVIISLYAFTQNRLQTETINIRDNHLSTEDGINSYFSEIDDKTSHNKPSLYKQYLTNVLDQTDRVLGKRKFFSLIALVKHFILAYMYTSFFFMIVWFFGADGNIGQTTLLPDVQNLQVRINILYTIVLLVIL